MITDINTLTPWTLLLMYFLPFRPTGAHSIYRAGGAAAYRENFSPKKPSFPHTHTHTNSSEYSRLYFTFIYIIYIQTHTHPHHNVVERAFSVAAFSRSAERPPRTPHCCSISSSIRIYVGPWRRRRVDKFRAH